MNALPRSPGASARAVLPAALLAAVALLAPWAGAAPAHAAGLTFHVASTGSDAAPGTADAPVRTIGAAVAQARSGDAVVVAPGRYPETVTIPRSASGVTIRATGPGAVVEGGGVRRFGFFSNDRTLAATVVEGFEVTGQTEAAVAMTGTGLRIAGNHVHDIGAGGLRDAHGVRVRYGARNVVTGNTIRSIGPGSEAKGVLLQHTRDATVSGNVVQLVRKEGVRDYMGLDNVIRDNRISLCWTGVELAASTGTSIVNNYVHDTTNGFFPKHTSDQPTLTYWGLTEGRWVRFRHNTVYRSSKASVVLGMNAPAADLIDVRNNVLSGAGEAQVWDAPEQRGRAVLDGNHYSPRGGRPDWAYHTGWDPRTGGHADVPAVRAALGWEAGGTWDDAAEDPWAPTPPAGELTRTDGPDQGGEFGRQVGAAGLAPEPTRWAPEPMQAVASSSLGTWSTRFGLGGASDGRQHTYWMTTGTTGESVTWDFGAPKTFQYVVVDLLRHLDKRNVRRFRFEGSGDGQTWETVLEGENADMAGVSHKYELPTPRTARYLRLSLLDPFCDAYEPATGCAASFVVSDVRVGRLDPVVAPRPQEPEAAVADMAQVLPATGFEVASEGTATAKRIRLTVACRNGDRACTGSVTLRAVSPYVSGQLSKKAFTIASDGGATQPLEVALPTQHQPLLAQERLLVEATAKVDLGDRVVTVVRQVTVTH